MRRYYGLLLASTFVAACATAQAQSADPPARVGRVSLVDGSVSLYPVGDSAWTDATVNYPVTSGDAFWADTGARAEIELGPSVVRMAAQTAVVFGEISDTVTQLRVDQGSVDIRVRELADNDVYEVDTPAGVISLTDQGQYRVDVTPDGKRATVTVRAGEADVTAGGQTLPVATGASALLTDANQPAVTTETLPEDEFEQWADARAADDNDPHATDYVSPDVVGYQDLDNNGTWQVDGTYGDVWIPRNVPADWAPYRYGHWQSVAPWGWTWIDDEPWGFAPFHYGRWAYVTGRWAWVPGARQLEPVYAPALVAFVSGPQFTVGVSTGPGVGWVPLAPGEPYVPGYHASLDYVRRVNRRSVNDNQFNPAHVDIDQIKYVNRQAPNGVTVVPRGDFEGARPVNRAAIAPRPNQLTNLHPSATPMAGNTRIPAPKRPVRPADNRSEPISHPPALPNDHVPPARPAQWQRHPRPGQAATPQRGQPEPARNPAPPSQPQREPPSMRPVPPTTQPPPQPEPTRNPSPRTPEPRPSMRPVPPTEHPSPEQRNPSRRVPPNQPAETARTPRHEGPPSPRPTPEPAKPEANPTPPAAHPTPEHERSTPTPRPRPDGPPSPRPTQQPPAKPPASPKAEPRHTEPRHPAKPSRPPHDTSTGAPAVMKRRAIGSLDVSVTGLGCNNFGGRLDAAATANVVHAALDAGVNFFDTATIYGGSGRSEQYLGQALRGRRDQAIIASKFGHAVEGDHKGGHPEYVAAAADASLLRLGVDRIDLYQLHQPDESVPIGETLGAMQRLVDAGKVREIGCSNFSPVQLREADAAARRSGGARFVSVQNEYSLFHRDPEGEMLDTCEELGVAFVPYFPLANGLLTGKYRAGKPIPAGTRLSEPRRAGMLSGDNLARVEALAVWAERQHHTRAGSGVRVVAAERRGGVGDCRRDVGETDHRQRRRRRLGTDPGPGRGGRGAALAPSARTAQFVGGVRSRAARTRPRDSPTLRRGMTNAGLSGSMVRPCGPSSTIRSPPAISTAFSHSSTASIITPISSVDSVPVNRTPSDCSRLAPAARAWSSSMTRSGSIGISSGCWL